MVRKKNIVIYKERVLFLTCITKSKEERCSVVNKWASLPFWVNCANILVSMIYALLSDKSLNIRKRNKEKKINRQRL